MSGVLKLQSSSMLWQTPNVRPPLPTLVSAARFKAYEEAEALDPERRDTS